MFFLKSEKNVKYVFSNTATGSSIPWTQATPILNPSHVKITRVGYTHPSSLCLLHQKDIILLPRNLKYLPSKVMLSVCIVLNARIDAPASLTLNAVGQS